MPPGRRGFASKLDTREVQFLANYYAADSPTKGHGVNSALAAGYSESTAITKWPRILKKYEDCSFRSSAKAVGITKPYLAMKLKQVMDTGGDKEVLAAIRLSLANMGEATDDSSRGAALTFNAPTMVILGMTTERMRALKSASPVKTREELEAESNQRSADRLSQLRRGELPVLPRHSKAQPAPKTTCETGTRTPENDVSSVLGEVLDVELENTAETTTGAQGRDTGNAD